VFEIVSINTDEPQQPRRLLRRGTPVASKTAEGHVADNEDDMVVVPIPGEEDEAERKRIRESNDRDQEMERQGERSRHNAGYDQAADGVPVPEIERVVDE
jgi:hypothetical protein